MKNRPGILLALAALVTAAAAAYVAAAQDSFPDPPADHTMVYVADEKMQLAPLAVEMGTTPLRVDEVAKGDKRSYVELKGAGSPFVITTDEPRLYLFLPDKPDAKPPFVVRLTGKGGARRVVAMAQKGYKGFAISAEEIMKPHYRVIAREGGAQFMEVRMREPLMAGEYAVIGTDLARVATFRVAPR